MAGRAFQWLVAAVALVSSYPAAAQREAGAFEAGSAVTVVLHGDATELTRGALDARRSLPVTVRFAELPRGTAEAPADGATLGALASARQRYVEADFEGCRAALGAADDARRRLAAGERTTAARLVFWRIACHVGAGELHEAGRGADAFASHGLSAPGQVELATPDVERLIATAMDAYAAAPRVALRFRSTAPRSRVVLDGGAVSCRAPCELMVGVGAHVARVEAPGYAPEPRLLDVSERGASVAFDPGEASPELASKQWHVRFGASDVTDSAASIALLSRAVRARRLVLLHAETEGDRVRLRGVLSIGGRVVARAERRPEGEDTGAGARALLRELLVDAHIVEPAPPLWRRAGLWIGTGLAAAAAATLTALLVRDPEVRTSVGF